MKTITKIAVTAAITMLPLAALADNTTAKSDATKSATSGMMMHGFDKYWSKMDPTGKGYVTKDEWLAHAADRFKEIDTNGDGKISKEEMQAHDKKMREHFMEMREHRREMMHDHTMNGSTMGDKNDKGQ